MDMIKKGAVVKWTSSNKSICVKGKAWRTFVGAGA